MYIPGIHICPCSTWSKEAPASSSNPVFAPVPEETTPVPYVDPLYEEYDYADCKSTSGTNLLSFKHKAGFDALSIWFLIHSGCEETRGRGGASSEGESRKRYVNTDRST